VSVYHPGVAPDVIGLHLPDLQLFLTLPGGRCGEKWKKNSWAPRLTALLCIHMYCYVSFLLAEHFIIQKVMASIL
jgi:hypothetical protein